MSPTPLSPDPPHSWCNLHHTTQPIHYPVTFAEILSLVLFIVQPDSLKISEMPSLNTVKTLKDYCSFPKCQTLQYVRGKELCFVQWSDFILSGLSLALNKEGCD